MTVPCSPFRLLWEALPDGLALYPFGRYPFDEQWLTDEAVMARIDEMHGPSVYVDLRHGEYLGNRETEKLIRLWVRVRRIGGRVILCNLHPDVEEVLEICNLLYRPDQLRRPFHRREGVPGGAMFPDPAWLVWGSGIVETLARTVSEGRDFDLMPVLGDALEDAGCTMPEVLGHCRGPGPHGRDCWVIRMLLEAPRSGTAPCPVVPECLPSTG